jgi:FlaA1/EpsC-like NDP-sugar epimerase
MIRIDGYRSSTSLLFAFIDSVLILLAVLMGIFLRFWRNAGDILTLEYLIMKIILIVFVIQMAFYYFDLHELKILRERKKMAILLLESLGASTILLAVIYYLVPFLAIGRGIFGISLSLIFLFAFAWRLLYVWMSMARTFKERILIVGTGELATKIKKEITENGYDGFEIVGFIDESSRDKVREDRG